MRQCQALAAKRQGEKRGRSEEGRIEIKLIHFLLPRKQKIDLEKARASIKPYVCPKCGHSTPIEKFAAC
jgi:predicted RNA-binding Zn-ribbon protein involved in translation (DUF1610 family)